jgi:hypothetical protein
MAGHGAYSAPGPRAFRSGNSVEPAPATWQLPSPFGSRTLAVQHVVHRRPPPSLISSLPEAIGTSRVTAAKSINCATLAFPK